MKIIRHFIIFFVILLLFGCSRIKFAYRQLDWLIPYYLDTYIDLTEQQSVYIEEQVEDLLVWHCSRHLPGYAHLFRSANSKFQTGQATRDDLVKFSARFEQYWDDLVLQVIPSISHLFVTSTEEQIDNFFKNLEEKNLEWLEEYRSQTPAERTIEYQERVGDELERWFGALSENQQDEIKRWAAQFKPLGMEGLKMRKQWQQRLQRLIFYHHNDPPGLISGLKELLLRPDQFRSSSYQKLLDENKKVTIELIYRVGKQLSLIQRKHLAGEIISVASDFEELSCKAKKMPEKLAASIN